MEENRYNVFNQIHKGLRAMLFETGLELQKTDFSQATALPLVEQLEQILVFFDEHAENEDRFILPHIQKHDPQLIAELEKDHEVDHKLTQALFEHINKWKLATSSNKRNQLGQQITFAFNELIAFNLYHMNKEENVLLYLLWKHYSDEQIKEMEAQIIQSIPVPTLMAESRWMMRAISDREIISWLSAVKQEAPPQVYDGFYQLAEQELPATRLASVSAALDNM